MPNDGFMSNVVVGNRSLKAGHAITNWQEIFHPSCPPLHGIHRRIKRCLHLKSVQPIPLNRGGRKMLEQIRKCIVRLSEAAHGNDPVNWKHVSSRYDYPSKFYLFPSFLHRRPRDNSYYRRLHRSMNDSADLSMRLTCSRLRMSA